MTQEDKKLLIKDLCGRFPNDIWIQWEGSDYLVTGYGHGRVSLLPSKFSSAVGPCPLVEEVKIYLHPMSSMTDDEKREYNYTKTLSIQDYPTIKTYDWLNEHMFDFRGLIKKGLAIAVTEENNPY